MIQIKLRETNPGDINTLFKWRNDPEIYKWFEEQKEPLVWENHVRWYNSRRNRKD